MSGFRGVSEKSRSRVHLATAVNGGKNSTFYFNGIMVCLGHLFVLALLLVRKEDSGSVNVISTNTVYLDFYEAFYSFTATVQSKDSELANFYHVISEVDARDGMTDCVATNLEANSSKLAIHQIKSHEKNNFFSKMDVPFHGNGVFKICSQRLAPPNGGSGYLFGFGSCDLIL